MYICEKLPFISNNTDPAVENFSSLSPVIISIFGNTVADSQGSKMSQTHDCHHSITVSSSHQTLDEMDFERGIWSAALEGNITRIHQLLASGTNVDNLDKAGYTALHYAARSGNVSVCKVLLESSANVNAVTRAGLATPLQRAALAGKEQVLELLLMYHADPKLQDTDGRTALHRAAEAGHIGIVKQLCQVCPELVHIRDKYDKLPCDYAVGKKYVQEALSEFK